MGKYLPGGIWPFLASAQLAKEAGLSRTTTVSSLLLAVMIGLGTGIIVALLTLPGAFNLVSVDWRIVAIVLLVPLVFVLPPVKATILRVAKMDFDVPAKTLMVSGLAAGLAWMFAGLHIALLVKAFGFQIEPDFVIHASGIYALAWITGFLFFIAPAGLGAREGVLVALLSVHIPIGDALVIALLSRVLVTSADFLLGGIAVLIRTDQAAR